jgi:hypothetical protein
VPWSTLTTNASTRGEGLAVHDFVCPCCGATYRDVVVPVSVGALQSGACCPACTRDRWVVYLTPVPALRLSLFHDGGHDGGPSDFQKFTLPVEDPGSPTGWRDVTISSLADIRRLERESEQRAKNGEGQALRWRDYSQDRTNRDVHTFGPDPSLRPPKRFLNGEPVVIRRGEPVVEAHGVPPEFADPS